MRPACSKSCTEGRALGGVTIRTAEHRDLGHLFDVELAAAELYATVGWAHLIEFTRAHPLSHETAAALMIQRSLFVAEDDGAVVGFAAFTAADGLAHLGEVDVLPSHTRRGIGRALIDRGTTWARDRGFAALTLATFRNVPWNAPFYARLGFREWPESAWGPGHRMMWQAQAEMGLDMAERLYMIRDLQGPRETASTGGNPA